MINRESRNIFINLIGIIIAFLIALLSQLNFFSKLVFNPFVWVFVGLGILILFYFTLNKSHNQSRNELNELRKNKFKLEKAFDDYRKEVEEKFKTQDRLSKLEYKMEMLWQKEIQ